MICSLELPKTMRTCVYIFETTAEDDCDCNDGNDGDDGDDSSGKEGENEHTVEGSR